ncbi:MAG: hypothetical protein GX483_04155 [Actinomycetaceae bacterium]|nr:hypothetical protein [Actinomycetaceae bacterium]
MDRFGGPIAFYSMIVAAVLLAGSWLVDSKVVSTVFAFGAVAAVLLSFRYRQR